MPIRPATYGDLWPAAKILAAAFKDNELMGEYMHPRRGEFPDDMRLFMMHGLRAKWVKESPTDHIIVSYSTDASGHEERITGVAQWGRFGKSPPPSLYRTSLQYVVGWYNHLESFVYPDRALDPTAADVLQRTEPFMKHHWTGTRGNVWHLENLGVDPACHGHGYGRELVAFGFRLARRDGVGCTVISADGSEQFYAKCGFDVTVGMARDEGGDANPLKDVRGGTIHFWDNGIAPEGVQKYGEA